PRAVAMPASHRAVSLRPLLRAFDAEERLEMIRDEKEHMRRAVDGGDGAKGAAGVVGKENVVLPRDHAGHRGGDVEGDDRDGELQKEAPPVDRDTNPLRVEFTSRRPAPAQGKGRSRGFVAHGDASRDATVIPRVTRA